MLIFITLNILACAIWYLVWHWRIKPYWIVSPMPQVQHTSGQPSLSILIPARNEAQRLPALFSSLRAITGDFEILVVDDESVDSTLECAAQAARLDPRIRAFSAPEKPAAWIGKSWALNYAAAQACGECLLFIDADVTVGEKILDIAESIMAAQQLDALSLIPAMRTPSKPAACLLACHVAARAIFLKPARPGQNRGITQGAFFAIRRRAYDAIGGHAAVAQCVVEDIALGRLLQNKGFRVLTLGAQNHLQTLAYSTLRETWIEMQKHIYPVLGFSLRNAMVWVFGIGFLAVYPVGALLLALAWSIFNSSAAALAMLGSALAATLISYSMLARIIRQEGLPLFAALALPVAFLAGAGLLAGSIFSYTRGRVTWKDRRYQAQ